MTPRSAAIAFALAAALTLALALAFSACQSSAPVEEGVPTLLVSGEVATPEIRGEEVAVLTHAPDVPPPITRDYATRVLVNLTTEEVVRELADGVEYTFWTFGGGVPGPFIRVREGDMVVIHLSNAPRAPSRTTSTSTRSPGPAAARPSRWWCRATTPRSSSAPSSPASTSTTARRRPSGSTSRMGCTA